MSCKIYLTLKKGFEDKFCDRGMVMCDGASRGILKAKEATREELGL
jgi:hypothetical protein